MWQTPFGNQYQRALSTHHGPSRNVPCKQQAANTRTMRWAKSAVKELLTGKGRTKLAAQQHFRLATIAKRERRTRNTFKALHAAVASAAIRAGRALIPPLPENDLAVEPLSNLIGQYAIKLKVQATARAVASMCAAIVSRMTTGYQVGGVTVVPLIPVVAAHAPCELQHPHLLPVQCRSVSGAHRHLVTKTTTPQGFARINMCFPDLRSETREVK